MILRLEAEFIALQKIIFNGRFMPYLETSNYMPQEIIGGRMSQVAAHLALNKNLIADISTIRKLPIVTICTDAKKYIIECP